MRERLYRSRDDRMIFGVAGGMADWLDLDPAIVRLVWALLIVAGGVGFVLYIIAAIVIPEAPPGWSTRSASAAAAAGAEAGTEVAAEGGPATQWASPAPRPERRSNANGAVIIGVVLVALGGWFLLQRFIPAIDPSLLWPVVLLVLGLVLVVGSLRRGGSA